MLLHIGEDTNVSLDEVLFILDNRSLSDDMRRYIEKAKREHRYTGLGKRPPRSYVVSMEKDCEIVYGTNISSIALEKRGKQLAMLNRFYIEHEAE